MLKLFIYHLWGPQKNVNHFRGIFGYFYPISFDKLVIVQNFPILHFPDTTGHDQLGKKL